MTRTLTLAALSAFIATAFITVALVNISQTARLDSLKTRLSAVEQGLLAQKDSIEELARFTGWPGGNDQ